jgi:tetratricopeptide (TPR) repeat protein
MMTIARISILFALLMSYPVNALCDGPARLVAGDAAFAQMDYRGAVREYQGALSETPNDPVLLCRLSRAYVCIGEVEQKQQEREAVLRKAESCARECVRKDPQSGEGHTWLAAALGYLALEVGLRDQVSLSNELLAATDRALAINPKDDIALSIRGSFYRALGNIGWFKKQLAALFVGNIPDGGFAEAEQYLIEAVEIAPDIMRHRYELGILYVDMGRIPEACAQFARAMKLPVRVAIDRPRLEKVRAFLEEFRCVEEADR